jgi:hypothetical protein
MLRGTSHEIRTPLNGIIGMVQILLERTQLTDEQQECLYTIKTSSNNLLTLLNNLLDLSKIEAGMIELEQRNFSIRTTLTDVIAIQISLVRNKGLTFHSEIQEDIPDDLIGDQLRLKQILLNLLGNAIKFTDHGGVCITITISEQLDGIIFLKISVTDSGIGISEEAMEKIFNPFTQADSSTTRQYGGSGLGLSICTRFAELMGGRIWAESTLGRGSTFNLEVPFLLNTADSVSHLNRNNDQSLAHFDAPPLSEFVPSSPDMALFSIERERLTVLFGELESLLQSRDMAVNKKILELIKLVPATTSIETLRHHVRQCNFNGALACLEDICRELGVTH